MVVAFNTSWNWREIKKKKQNTWQQGSTNSATLKALIEFSKIFMVEYKELLSCLVISNVDSAVLGPYKLPFNTFPKSVLFFSLSHLELKEILIFSGRNKAILTPLHNINRQNVMANKFILGRLGENQPYKVRRVTKYWAKWQMKAPRAQETWKLKAFFLGHHR